MRNYWKILFFFGLQLSPVSGFAQQINVNTLHYTTTAQQNRILFDVTVAPEYRVFVMDNPSRLVIDIKNARLEHALTQPSAAHPLFIRVRAGVKNDTDLRIVVDLKAPIDSKNFTISSNNNDNYRLIVDLFNKEPIVAIQVDNKPAIVAGGGAKAIEPKTAATLPVVEKSTGPKSASNIVIAIDAGHGGDDPGARGSRGTEEKKVTFAIAKKLEALINGQPGMKAVMVRKDDYYVGLRERMKIARAAKADLFVSIHADAFHDAEIKGASVYTLSTGGASSEAARWLADNENSSDLVGVSLNDKEDVLASVLLDLSQTATQEASVNVANRVLKSFDNIADLHKDSVQKADFIVLKSPDIPSILVETAFISNPSEERNLLSAQYQSKMATAIFNGVRSYFKESVPVDSKIAALGL
jgi:N-acetylmuramoyl-L-alanine amidase